MFVSMSRPARPWENAYCESFMRTPKMRRLTADSTQQWRNWSRTLKTSLKASTTGNGCIRRCTIDRRKSLKRMLHSKPFSMPLALSFPRHREIYPDIFEQENGGAVLL